MIGRITNSGVDANALSVKFADKLITRNKFSLLCIIFSSLYLIYFVAIGQILPFFLLLTGILLFSGSIALNRYKKYTLSCIFVLISTNYCVLFTSMFFGFESGFHLYLLISPLIVFVLFSREDGLFFKAAIASYIFTFLVVMVMGKNFQYRMIELSSAQSSMFYLFNFLFASVLLIVLLLYFSFNNARVNNEIERKNVLLTEQQRELSNENKIRKEAEEKLLSSLKEKDILLSEVHHRVKNNLAVVSALLDLERNNKNASDERNIIRTSQNRIKAIALLHELLYQNESIELVNIKTYITQLTKYLELACADKLCKVNFQIQSDYAHLKFNRAMPFALILNELICQSFQLAEKKNSDLNIMIHLEKNQDQIIFFYKDNLAGFNGKENENSFSFSLIELLISQLNAESEILSRNGKIFNMRFKREE